jgi:hypothetical protein
VFIDTRLITQWRVKLRLHPPWPTALPDGRDFHVTRAERNATKRAMFE